MNMVQNRSLGRVKHALMWVMLLVLTAGAVSCGEDDSPVIPQNLRVTQFTVDEHYTLPSDGAITILGKGFAQGDKVTLTNSDKEVYDATVTAVTEDAITFSLPAEFPQTGRYTIRVIRGDEDLVLGNSEIELIYDFGVQNIAVDAKYNVLVGKAIRIGGNGFVASDVIKFTQSSGNKETFEAKTSAADGNGIDVVLPVEMVKGAYSVSMVRNERSATIGSTSMTFAMNTEMPEQAGATLMGMVYCGYTPLSGVVVSDGVNVTVTDDQGRYYLNSAKDFGYVFVSTPGGYTAAAIAGTNTPQHFKYTVKAATDVEQVDFELKEESQRNYVVMTMADMHLANRNNDLDQFKSFLSDVNAKIAEYEALGNKVYGITLGDQSWDVYWYDNKFAMKEAMAEVAKIKCPVYNCAGNHDNDPYCADNFKAQQAYIDNVGPNYYSFNLGLVHYVVLDNTYYINTGGSQGVIGERNYSSVIDDVQMEWLKKDLATVEDKTMPLVICMHIPLHSYPWVNGSGEVVQNVGMASGQALIDAVSGFSDVKMLTGHTHLNYDAEANGGKIFEQNTAAVCATWWWTGKNGYAGNHLCKDGVPGGYGIWEVTNHRTMKHYYKGIGYPLDYQFRTTDLNQVYITADEYAPKCTDAGILAQMGTWTAGYEKPNKNNEVLINVFNWGKGWSIKVTENGKTLATKRVYRKDPLHIISYEMQRLNQGGTTKPTDTFNTIGSTKTFLVTATSATSTLEITVTDRYGNVYTETMERPKAFHTGMK